MHKKTKNLRMGKTSEQLGSCINYGNQIAVVAHKGQEEGAHDEFQTNNLKFFSIFLENCFQFFDAASSFRCLYATIIGL